MDIFVPQANQHDELVNYLCQFGDEDDLLNVYEDVEAPSSPASEDIYAKPKKTEKKPIEKKPQKPPKPPKPLKKTPSGYAK